MGEGGQLATFCLPFSLKAHLFSSLPVSIRSVSRDRPFSSVYPPRRLSASLPFRRRPASACRAATAAAASLAGRGSPHCLVAAPVPRVCMGSSCAFRSEARPPSIGTSSSLTCCTGRGLYHMGLRALSRRIATSVTRGRGLYHTGLQCSCRRVVPARRKDWSRGSRGRRAARRLCSSS